MPEPWQGDGLPHPSDEILAAYVDGRLLDAVRGDVEAHIADCETCLEVVSTVVASGVASDAPAAGGPTSKGAPARRPIEWAYVAVAAAALVTLAIVLPRPTRSDPSMSRLIEAVSAEPSRPVEGRLSEPFPWAPPPTAVRGGTAFDVPADVRIVVAEIEKRASAENTPANDAAFAVAHLVSGNLDNAIDILERLDAEHPSPAVHNNLAAALLSRAIRQDRADDWARALAAADRAVKGDPECAAAHFNRALALEGLRLDESALRAWAEFRSRERNPDWLSEAADHEAALRRRLSGARTNGRDNQALREEIEDHLLGRWAAAQLNGDDGSDALTEARRLSVELAARNGDRMPRDAVEAIAESKRRDDHAAVQALASGHLAFSRARELFLAGRLDDASQQMARAAGAFDRVQGPYALWAPVFAAIALRTQGLDKGAIALLRRLDVKRAHAYANLRGRVDWTEAIALEGLGRFDAARDRLLAAVSAYETAGEAENLAATRTHLAEAYWYLGERTAAWRTELDALEGLHAVRAGVRRNAVLFNAARFALDEDLPEAALYFQDALVAAADAGMRGAPVATAYRQRGRIRARLGDQEGSQADMARADAQVPEVRDTGLRERTLAEQRAAWAELQVDSNPEAGAASATEALDYFERIPHWDRVSDLLVVRAAAKLKVGDAQEARSDLAAAALAAENARRSISTFGERLAAFELQRRTWKQLAALELSSGSASRAVQAAESGRWAFMPFGGSGSVIDPALAASALPSDVAVIYFIALDDRLFTWVLKRDASVMLERNISERVLAQIASRVQRVAQDGGDAAAVALTASTIVDHVLHPALRIVGSATQLVVIPDGPIGAIPFAALPGLSRRPLAIDYTITMAPSLTSLVRSSERLRGFRPHSALAIGDGHDTASSGLPRLRFADQEARLVASLYSNGVALEGKQGTRDAFIGARAAVVHFAGHTVLNDRSPLLSRMLFAPGSDFLSSGWLTGSDVASVRLHDTGLIVLASCESATNRLISGDGAVSIASLFLVAGVPSVIASLWPVDDAPNEVIVGLHQRVAAGMDPSEALVASQVQLLQSRGYSVPVRVWAGLVSIGGISSLNLERS